MKTIETSKYKMLYSNSYNYIFNKENGFFARWGKNKDDDPDFSPFGPEIADIEISTICNGLGNPCPWCYKGNTSEGKNMSLETFKQVFAKLPNTLTQVAFGIGSIEANPELFDIMEYCREKGVIPNITINGYDKTGIDGRLSQHFASRLAEVCGAIAVSHYSDIICYHAINMLTLHGAKQVNIHKLLSEETYKSCFKVIDDAKEIKQLADLNAIVFLVLKEKGPRNNFHSMKSVKKMKKLIEYAKKKNIAIGFDSCSAPTVLRSAVGGKDFDSMQQVIEPCESFHFSIYINVDSEVFPCSFLEGQDGYEPINIIERDFDEIWNGKEAKSFREKIKKDELGCRLCPEFDLYERKNT